MNGRDAIGIAAGNLRRMKLRAGLTTAGVVIAIGAFVAMLSFGAGNHKLIADRAESLGLLNTVQVMPSQPEDSLQAPPLDEAAVARLQALPAVRLAYPLESLTLEVELRGDSSSVEAQALLPAALETRLFSQFRAGASPAGEREVLVTDRFLSHIDLPYEQAASLVGDTLFVSLKVASLDSAIVRAFTPGEDFIPRLMNELRMDSLTDIRYRQRLASRELGGALQRFMNGYLNGRVVRDTLIVAGVLEGSFSGRNVPVKPLILSPAVATRFQTAGRPADPMTLFAALERGELFEPIEHEGEGFAQITLDLDPYAPFEAVRDSLVAWGYRYHSFAEQFAEIRRIFFFFQLALSAVGLVALSTAALGIINTMLMSISERRREIGVLKSLGAHEGQIRALFLTESALIGAVGSGLGILLGWTVARIASAIARAIMVKQGAPSIELFATPGWLVLGSFVFGVLVSLLAGAAPAARAARVDPVEALRGD